jgi:hypothetical protein
MVGKKRRSTKTLESLSTTPSDGVNGEKSECVDESYSSLLHPRPLATVSWSTSFWVALVFSYLIILVLISNWASSQLPNPSVCSVAAPAVDPSPKSHHKWLKAWKASPVVKGWKGARSFTRFVLRRKSKTTPLSALNSRYNSIAIPQASTSPPKISSLEQQLLTELATRVHQKCPDVLDRAKNVPWGGHGDASWWFPVGNHTKHKSLTPLGQKDGGFLLYGHYRILSKSLRNPRDLSFTHFPFRLCKTGCPAEQGVLHTLQWRETYRPWMMSPSGISENRIGWVYTRGFAKASPQNSRYGRHAMIWVRPGMHQTVDGMAYFRVILNTVDAAIAASLRDSHGRVGKFNAVIDTTNYEWSKMPNIAHIKQHVTMLQDHYPDRLGVLLLINLSRSAEFFVNIVKNLLTKEVREKIMVLPHNKEKALAQLGAVVENEYIPDWLGGPDRFRFDASHYYAKQQHMSEVDSRSFLVAMPYHAN